MVNSQKNYSKLRITHILTCQMKIAHLILWRKIVSQSMGLQATKYSAKVIVHTIQLYVQSNDNLHKLNINKNFFCSQILEDTVIDR